jgi:hypothetical protein
MNHKAGVSALPLLLFPFCEEAAVFGFAKTVSSVIIYKTMELKF